MLHGPLNQWDWNAFLVIVQRNVCEMLHTKGATRLLCIEQRRPEMVNHLPITIRLPDRFESRVANVPDVEFPVPLVKETPARGH